jgi:hypothetical protein
LSGCYYYAPPPGPVYGYAPPPAYGYAYPSVSLGFGYYGRGCCYGGWYHHHWGGY